MTNITEVAVAILLKPDGTFLLSSRPEGKPYAGYWEFPGGKIEAGESVRAALVRELHEELNVTITETTPWFTFVMRYTHATVRLHCWRVAAWHGEMRGMEGQQFRWQSLAHMTVSPTLPGCVPIFSALRLPYVYVITNATEMGVAAYLEQLRALLRRNAANNAPMDEFRDGDDMDCRPPGADRVPVSGRSRDASEIRPRPAPGRQPIANEYANASPFMIQIREKQLPPAELESFATAVIQLARESNAIVVINHDIELATKLGADGVHLTSTQLATLNTRPDFAFVGASTHSRAELERAAELKCDFAVLGPVKATRSHPGQAPIGWHTFAQWVEASPLPCYALGGLVESDLQSAVNAGAQGISLQRGLLLGA
jgi:8-oxo-dGTP diphosphatase